MSDYNLQQLNDISIFSIKSLLTLHSGGFIALLSLGDKVENPCVGISFAVGLTTALIMIACNYFTFSIAVHKKVITNVLTNTATVMGFVSAGAFLSAVWITALNVSACPL